MIDVSQIEDVLWYSGTFPGIIGIVLVNTGFGYKAYIGPGGALDEEVDKLMIAHRGARFQDAPKLWPHIEKWAR